MHEEEINRLVNMVRTYNESLRSEIGQKMSVTKFYMRRRIAELINKLCTKLKQNGHDVIICASLKPNVGYSHLEIDGVKYTV